LYAQRSPTVPSQLPAQTVPSLAHAWREPTGAPTTGMQLPSLPATLHASHWPVHGSVQHTPSTQIPDAHSALVLQAVPAPFLSLQTPPEQN
jgi:hypothetical protein